MWWTNSPFMPEPGSLPLHLGKEVFADHQKRKSETRFNTRGDVFPVTPETRKKTAAAPIADKLPYKFSHRSDQSAIYIFFFYSVEQ